MVNLFIFCLCLQIGILEIGKCSGWDLRWHQCSCDLTPCWSTYIQLPNHIFWCGFGMVIVKATFNTYFELLEYLGANGIKTRRTMTQGVEVGTADRFSPHVCQMVSSPTVLPSFRCFPVGYKIKTVCWYSRNPWCRRTLLVSVLLYC